jgi:hypothetical protein
LVRKLDGTWRLCIDYRRLNEVTRVDTYPLPRIDETIDKLRGARYFSLLDLASGYWQLPLRAEDVEKTASAAGGRLWESPVLPMGVCNAPGAFQRAMNDLFAEMINRDVLIYIGDTVVHSSTWAEHKRGLEKVLCIMRAANLKAKITKCRFGMSEITYLGFRVSADGILPDPEKARAIEQAPAPLSVKALRGFLGLVGFYRTFIRNFAAKAAPLTMLLKSSATWTWGAAQEEAFQTLKKAITQAPILAYPNPSEPYEVHVDASDQGLGGMLVQRDKEGKPHMVQCMSRTLRPYEQHYHIPELECLAVVWATKKSTPLHRQRHANQNCH